MNDLSEDIKILEEYKTKGYSMLLMKYGDRITTNLRLERALENLIKGYRELEKELERIKSLDIYKLVEDYETGQLIPKSKIKEKIEELNDYDSEFCQRVSNHNELTLTELIQNILQELMEDK